MFDQTASFRVSRRALLGLLTFISTVPVAAVRQLLPETLRRARPGEPAWPTAAEWASLSRQVGGRLISGAKPSLDGAQAPELMSNPLFIGEQIGLTQSSGWLGAWRSEPSVYAVKARDAFDVAAAVRFASAHRLRLVIKGGGHSYLGGSNAPDSLLVWTRAMDSIQLHDGFVPTGTDAAPVAAVSVGAGCIWGRVYRAVCVEGGRYVQGGGCTTVGVAGLVQGGGFGSFSKGFGTAAAHLLEAEVVTADGQVRVVNASRDPDLFWALKGGGGGTFGIVTRLTLRTHQLPASFGAVKMILEATSDEAFHRLLSAFLDFAAGAVINRHWGEQVRATRANRLIVNMLWQGLTEQQARAVWRPFLDLVATHGDEWKTAEVFETIEVSGRELWDSDFLSHLPGAIRLDNRPGARAKDFWWAGDGDQAGAFWSAYMSMWLPRSLLRGAGKQRLADAWFNASRHWSVAFHFNKGLAGAPPEAVAATRETATNPEVLDAFALAIIASDAGSLYPGLRQADLALAKSQEVRVRAAYDTLRRVAPEAGTYLSECDYFLRDWKRASWGRHWQRLEAVKQRYDPQGLFVVHHGVASDRWSRDGFERI